MRALTTLLLLRLALAQAGTHDALAYVPLQRGAEWTYRTLTTTEATAKPVESRVTTAVLGSYRDGDAVRYVVYTAHGRSPLACELWTDSRDGFQVQQSPDPAIVTAADGCSPPVRRLAAPVGAVTEWSWREGPAPGGGDDEAWQWTARVESFAARVTVPAGTFDAVHVVARGRQGKQSQKRETWYAAGTGIVRERTRHGDERQTHDLLAFRRGFDDRPARDGLLQMQLDAGLLWSVDGPATVRWFDLGAASAVLPGQIALIENHGQHHCAFVGGDRAFAFDPGDGAAWHRLLGQLVPRPSTTALSHLLAHTNAHKHGCRVIEVFADEAVAQAPPFNRGKPRMTAQPWRDDVELQVLDASGARRHATLSYDLDKQQVAFTLQ